METINDSKQKVVIEYPCNWCYKIIASERAALEQAIRDVIDERDQKVNGEARETSLDYSVSHSNKSKTGKYISMNLDLLVHNEDDRTFIFDALKRHQDIKMVL